MTWQDIKDYWWGTGILLTFIAAAWNLILTYRTARETRFINTVTAERVKWIQELRNNISRFCGATHSWMTMYAQAPLPDARAEDLLKEIDRLRYLIRLQLNTREEPDQTIEATLLHIPNQTNRVTLGLLQMSLEELTRSTQILLKKEWEKVKSEAVSGKLSVQPNMWVRLVKWLWKEE